MEDKTKAIKVLNQELGLSPYESKAYFAFMIHGEMSPSELAQNSGIPRPRTYDVLSSLMERGLLIERFGKPRLYAAVEPTQGIRKLLTKIETETIKQLEDKREKAQSLIKALSMMYERSKDLKLGQNKVSFTRRDSAFIATYVEAIRKCKKELLVASTSLDPPEKVILESVKYALEKGTTVRAIRQIVDSWSIKDIERYEDVIKAGSQVKYLDVNEIQLRFMVFDDREVILVFPKESNAAMKDIVEALWLRTPPLARILHAYFQELWTKGKPMLPILEKIKKKKASQT